MDYDAIVIGAGYAGVTAARDLRDRGLSVLLLEARDRIGGRTYSRPFEGRDDIVAEYGGTFFTPEFWPQLAREIARYDIETAYVSDVENSVFYTGGERRTGLPVPAEELGDVERAWIRVASAAARIRPDLPLSQQALSDLDVPASELFAPLNLPEATRDFFYSLISMNVGGRADDFSLLTILGWIAGFGNSPYMIYGALSQKFKNGTAELPQTMIDDSGTELRLSSPVTHVVHEDRSVRVTTAGGDEWTAGACVVAVPTNTLRDIEFAPELSEGKRELAQETHGVRGLKLNLVVEDIPPRFQGMGMGPLQFLFTDRQLPDGSWFMSGYGAQSDDVDVTDLDYAQRAVELYSPGARVLEVDAHDWANDPFSQGTWRVDAPGRTVNTEVVMNAPESPRLFFAGADIVEGVWGVALEGAVISGHTAAYAACEALGRLGERTHAAQPA